MGHDKHSLDEGPEHFVHCELQAGQVLVLLSNHEYVHVSQFVADPVQVRQLKSQNSQRIVVESFIP